MATTANKIEKIDFNSLKYVKDISLRFNLTIFLQELFACTIAMKSDGETKKSSDSITNKIATIFYWITTQVEKPDIDISSTIRTQNNFGSMKHSYPWQPFMFELLCKEIGVKCQTVQGYARSVSSIPIPNNFKLNSLPTKPNHIWNVAEINDEFFLFDILWTMRIDQIHLKSINSNSHDSKPVSNIDCNFEYFMVKLDHTRSTHLPLLNYSKADLYKYLIIPILMPSFVNLLLQPANAVIEWKSNYGNENLKCLHFNIITDNQDFMHSVKFLGEKFGYGEEGQCENCEQSCKNIALKAFTKMEVNENDINIYTRLPWAGYYVITIFMKNSASERSNYKSVARLLLEYCQSDKQAQYFCGCSDMPLGINRYYSKLFGLSPVNFSAGLVNLKLSPPAYIEIYFSKDIPEIQFAVKIWRLKHDKCEETNKQEVADEIEDNLYLGYLDDMLLDDEDNLPEEVTFTIRIPCYGEYAIEIYANNPKINAEYINIIQYYIDVNENVNQKILLIQSL